MDVQKNHRVKKTGAASAASVIIIAVAILTFFLLPYKMR